MSEENIDKVYVTEGDTKSHVQLSLRPMGLLLDIT